MFIHKIIVQIGKSTDFKNSYQVNISQSLNRKWSLNTNESIFLLFGEKKQQIKIIETQSIKSIEISPDLAEELSIPFDFFPIHCLYDKEKNTLKLGPIISCITNQMYHEDRKFGSMTNFFEELASFSKRNHIFFYVNPIIEWNEKQFTGFIFHSGEWLFQKLPPPNAIYNRIGSRSFETSKHFVQFSEFLNKKGIKYFNDTFLDKWDIHNSLSSFPEIIPYLPETILFNDYETFVDLITRYNSIFIKPVNGSQGRQILRIEKKDDVYVVYYSSFSNETFTTFKSSYVLFNRLKERLKQQQFLIQEGLDLIDIDRRPLDFRILVVKDDDRLWKVISTVARISPEKRMVSNIAQGGEVKRPLDVLKALYDEKLSIQYVKLMKELTLEVAQLISESYDGLFGELGIDIGLDTNGKLWIIEINSKPSKSEDNNEKIRPSTKAIVAYLSYLAGFPFK